MSLDSFGEVLDVLRRNRLRTILTALSVAWGIFMLVLLLAAGEGLQNGVRHDFRDDATNSIWLRRGKTSKPFQGHAPGRKVVFQNDDLPALRRGVDGLEHMTGRFYLWGGFTVSRGNKTSSFNVRGVHPDHQFLERTIVVDGRFINDRDIAQQRKVAVIGKEVQSALFGSENPIGGRIKIRGVHFQVVGLFRDDGSSRESRTIYAPLTTAQLMYRGGNDVHQIMFTTGAATLKETRAMEAQTRALMAKRHHFDPEDRRAVQISNRLVQFQKVMQIFDWLRIFVWTVGIGTLFAGIVGVSNIMIISVQERTMEIGVRKALGATPRAILAMVLGEALTITALAGYAGLTASVMVVELVRRYMPDNDYLRDPAVNVQLGLVATLLLMGAGALAGLIPAFHAARVKPVVAMRGA